MTVPHEDASQEPLASHPSFMFAMGELSGQVAALRNELAYQREDRERQHAAMEIRLEKVEKWRYWTMGAAAAITTVINVLAFIWNHHG